MREMSGSPQEIRIEPGTTLSVASLVSEFKPVVLRGLCAQWPLVRTASDRDAVAYLRSFDSGHSAEAFLGEPAIAGRYHYGDRENGFNFSRRTMKLSEALDVMMMAGAEPGSNSVYMGSLPIDTFLPGFASANAMEILPTSIVPRIWIGTAGTVACHYDTQDNLACVGAGRRRFTLYPPDAIADLYVGPIDHTLAGQPISLAAGAAPGDARYPRFEAARDRALTIELEGGDALYLPKLWWHQVEALEPFNILVNYWWDAFAAGPDQPYTAMMLAMIAIAERPVEERGAWRAFFDHYVFRPERHPLAHMPEEQRGVLGSLRPQNYGRIRAMVMRLLRGE
jgi:hypothetical protein